MENLLTVLPFDPSLSPPVFLAPLAGITDLPFRSLVSSFGAGLVVSEMIASHDMVVGRTGSREKAELGFRAENTAVQIAGRESYWMAEAARMAETNGAKMIDINMGCPAKKVVNGYSGSALLRDLSHAMTLIEAVVGAVDVPVSLKTRLGWDENTLNAAQLAKMAEGAGIVMVTIHGRTRCQFYKGRADWAAIKNIKEAVSIPVIANGDITDEFSAQTALNHSNADGVMIGRGAQGRPWILAEVAQKMFNCNARPRPTGGDFEAMVGEHYEAMLDFYGPELGMRVARKHLGWYMDEVTTPRDIRRLVLTSQSTREVIKLLTMAFSSELAD
ncbi:MAG: tRNA dihydrouridine synthase DusB [Paracoccaceae bacterium]|nr:tRNA dihydrouridine synthase DusB [Paracoccaceae bacterium]